MLMLLAARQHLTVSLVPLANMAQEAVQRVLAAVTVRQVDTLQWLTSLGLLQTTALLAMQGDMVLVVAQLAYALVTVPQVDTLQLLTSLAPLQTIV